ncbi:hypothetical protein BKA70DRAFT_1252855 [Coprinopsis sp. MPI-PUGE-AT-0042]|nr:hypothetical protein BKA70DRAFT_1252855 [Coprinopsis sp. MPI-PUGE-AT-0042]
MHNRKHPELKSTHIEEADMEAASSASLLATQSCDAVGNEIIDTGNSTPSNGSGEFFLWKNGLLPIFQLPPELSVKIFVALTEITASEEDAGPLPKTPSWVVVTHVCRRWRALALGTPSLWTKLSSSFPKAWLEAMLVRSKQAKLDIVLPAHTRCSSPNIIQQSLLNPARLRSLDSSDEFFAEAIKQLEPEAPHLEKLILTNSNINKVQRLPPGFLSSNTPMLRTLGLMNWSLSQWRSRIVTALNHFDLWLDSTRPDTLSAVELLDVLDSMPTLSSLRLAGHGIPRIDNKFHRVVQLPRLQSLVIASLSTETCTSLLNALAVPVTAEAEVPCEVGNIEASQSVYDIGAALTACCLTSPLNPSALSSPPSYKYLLLDFVNVWFVNVTASLQHPTRRSHPIQSHTFRLFSLVGKASNLLPSLLESLPLEQLSRLDLLGKSPYSSSDIAPLLTHPRIETIHVTGTQAATAFLLHAWADMPPAGTSIPLPGLKNFSIFRAECNNRLLISQLHCSLSDRKAMGIEIHRLRLANCLIPKQEEDRLKSQCRVFEVSDED